MMKKVMDEYGEMNPSNFHCSFIFNNQVFYLAHAKK